MAELLNITHETGDLSQYDTTVVDGGDLSVNGSAAIWGSYGLQCVIDDTTSIYGQVNVTVSGNDVRFRFMLDPNSLTMTSGDGFRICHWRLDASPWNLCMVTLNRTDALGYYVQASAEEDDGTTLWTSNVAITDASHCVEVHIDRATSNVADDGQLRIWIDDSLEDTVSNVDNYDLWDDISDVRIGAIAGIDAGTSGTFYLDDLYANDDGGDISCSTTTTTVTGTTTTVTGTTTTTTTVTTTHTTTIPPAVAVPTGGIQSIVYGGPEYEIWLTDDSGVRIALLDNFTQLDASRVVNGLGWIDLVLPDTFDTSLIEVDRMIQVWRAPAGGELYLWRPYFIRAWRFETSERGEQSITLSGPDCNDLLRRRIVVGYSGSDYAKKSDYADDMMKEYVTEAMSDTPTPTPSSGSREWDNLSVAADLSNGPELTKSANFGRLMLASGGGVLSDLAKAALEAGTEVFFDVVPDTVERDNITFEFRTYTGQPGQDVSDRVVFDQARGNLSGPMLEYDYSEEVNYVYAGGQGEGEARNIQQVYSAVRYNRSQWNRCEAFADARNETSNNGVREAGRKILREGRQRIRFSGTPIDTAGTRFGYHWDFGYKVRSRYWNKEFDAIIRAVVLSVSSSGETIQARLEYES